MTSSNSRDPLGNLFGGPPDSKQPAPEVDVDKPKDIKPRKGAVVQPQQQAEMPPIAEDAMFRSESWVNHHQHG